MKFANTAVAVAITWFTQQDYVVSIPLSENQSYDLVVEKDGILKTVQIKSVTYKAAGKFEVGLRTTGRSPIEHRDFDHSAVDWLFVLTADMTIYFIPTSEFSNTNSLTLGDKYARFKYVLPIKFQVPMI